MTIAQDRSLERGGGLKDWKSLAAGACIVGVALLLRMYRIGDHEFWYDEALSFRLLSIQGWGAVPLVDFNPPLYHVLLRIWAAFAGHSEAALRMLSAVCGTLFVLALIRAGQEILGRRAGLWAGAFGAVAPIHVYYSQEARTYVLLTLTLVLAYVTLWRALKSGTWMSWALVSASALLALYSHYFAILGLFPTVFLVVMWPDTQMAKQRMIRYAAAMLLSGLLFLPWVLWSLRHTLHGAFTSTPGVGISWMQKGLGQFPAALWIPRSLEILGLGGQAKLTPVVLKQFTHLEFPGFLRTLGLAILLFLGIVILVPRGDDRLGVPWLATRKLWLALCLFFPLLTLWLVSFVKPLYLTGRYDIMGFPAYALLAGLAFSKLEHMGKTGPLLARIVALGLLIPIGTKLVLYYQAAPQKNVARRIASALHASVDNSDTVLFTGMSGLPILYYLNRLGYRWEERSCVNEAAGRRFSCRLFPREFEQPYFTPTVYDPNRPLYSEEVVREDVQDYLQPAHSAGGHTWVVFGQYRRVNGELWLPEEDVPLIKELLRLGLKPEPDVGSYGIFRFRRS